MSDEKDWGVILTMPLPDEQIFRYQATGDILELLYRNPHREFTITELREITGHGGKSVDNAITTLESLNLVSKHRQGRKSLVELKQAHVMKPGDKYMEIIQPEFRDPVREFVQRAKAQQKNNLVGIILFGSVARGEADRTSDIDLQVIVKDDLTKARRGLHEIRQELEEQKFDGERYEFHLLIESIESAESYGEKLQEIFSEGITLYNTDSLKDVKDVIFNGQ